MQHILVTGGNGFIASHLVDSLASSGYRVTVLDLYPRPYEDLPHNVNFIQGNLLDVHLIRRILQDQHIELVYHAAWATIHETSLKDPVADIEANIVTTLNLLNACKETGVKRVIFISSGGTVYGIPQSSPIVEDHPTNPINAYGISKLMVEKYLKMFHHLYGLEYVILRPSVPYGPRQNPFRNQGVVTVFLYNALTQKPVTIWGDGEVTRDFFYIQDLTRALLSAKDIPFVAGQNIFNLGGNRPYTLNELIGMINKTLNIEMKVNHEGARKFDVSKLILNTQAAKEKLNWLPSISLDEGIVLTAEWLRKWIDMA
jgi:UDP-glucose 4-epimerase